MKAVVSGSIYAEKNIFNPGGYAYTVFGDVIDDMTYSVSSVKKNKMTFSFTPVEVNNTDMDATLIEEVSKNVPTDYFGNIFFTVNYFN